jgi:hypothetical protein
VTSNETAKPKLHGMKVIKAGPAAGDDTTELKPQSDNEIGPASLLLRGR